MDLLWCWRRLLRVPWTARRSNQSILKEISPGISLGGMMLKLKLQYFGHLMRRVDSLEKTLMLGGIGGRRRRGRQRMQWLDGITDSMEVSESAPGVGDGQGGLACCDSWGRKGSDTTERLNWTDSFPKCLIRNVISMFCGLLQEYIKTQTPSPCHPQSSCSSPFLFLSLDSEQRKCKDSDSYSFFSHSMTAYLSSLDQSVYIICISINFPVDPVSNHLSPEFFLVIATKLTSML